MALPTSGPLSLFAIFAEIYGRQPNVGERVSFHDLVAASNLADKSFPCPFSRFYGYQHPTVGNSILVSLANDGSSYIYVSARADYPVASDVAVTCSYTNDSSGTQAFILTLPAGGNFVDANIPVPAGSSSTLTGIGSWTPARDARYTYTPYF